MIRKIAIYDTLEQAEEAATQMFSTYNKPELGGVSFTRHEDIITFCPLVIEDNDTGAAIVVFKTDEGGFRIVYMAAEERKSINRTYRYRDASPQLFLMLVMGTSLFYRPTKPITIDQITTKEGEQRLAFFIGHESTEFCSLADMGELSIEHLFDKDGGVDMFPYADEITERTGAKIRTATDYARGYSELLGGSLNKFERDEIISGYLQRCSFLLQEWVVYEFFRTESYKHLKEVTDEARRYMQPSQWNTSILGSNKAEAPILYAIAKYIDKDTDCIDRGTLLSEIAEYIGAPLQVVLRANKVNVNVF